MHRGAQVWRSPKKSSSSVSVVVVLAVARYWKMFAEGTGGAFKGFRAVAECLARTQECSPFGGGGYSVGLFGITGNLAQGSNLNESSLLKFLGRLMNEPLRPVPRGIFPSRGDRKQRAIAVGSNVAEFFFCTEDVQKVLAGSLDRRSVKALHNHGAS